jgi:solute carrier family 25 carnitine/acylcarnitine transporter 20/29
MNEWFRDFVCGSISGMFGTFCGHPLDTVKIRLQLNSKAYNNTFYSIAKIIREEKILGLFKGVVPPMLNQFPINAM